MEGSHYPSNGISSTSAGQNNYPSPTSLSPNHLQTGSPLPQHQLPPLQPATSANMQPNNMYGSHPHTPRTPGTPNTPNSTQGNYQPSTQAGSRPSIYGMPPQNPYQPHQGYGTTGPMMPNSTTASAHPQPIAPAPPNNRGAPVLRPMPPGGIMNQPGVSSSPYGHSPMMQHNPALQDGDAPTHVVGSQGRRGILPSAPGRPAAPAAGTGASKSTVIPVKDADGKFPCPHCTKTYLHAKHLKRHLLRHTGDRPYMCVLCRDTFSRSDILKRHFQKCSIRRGNPTGASHLSHPQAHVKKNAQKNAALGGEGEVHINGMNNMSNDGMVHPFGMVPVADGMNNMPSDQNQISRSSSMGRMENGNGADRRAMPGSMINNGQGYPNEVPNPMGNQQMPGYSMPPGQNGMPMYGGNANNSQQSGLDWSQMFQQGAHSTYTNETIHPNRDETQAAIKPDLNSEPYSTDADADAAILAPPLSNWGLPANTDQPYDRLSDQLLDFFFPAQQAVDPHLAGINLYFAPDNIKNFLTQFTHFHVHVPLIHVSTINIPDAYTGLVAAMCCVGACYSDRVRPDHVREMMDFTWTAVARDCGLWTGTKDVAAHDQMSQRDMQELQASLLLIILLTWNGTPEQRSRARQIHPYLVVNARRFNLLQVDQHPLSASALHQSDLDMRHFSIAEFDWQLWIDQESRIRALYGIYLTDVAMGLYFNVTPQLSPLEIHLPLPCDDVAWDAGSREQCSEALGLCGPDAAKARNPYGTQRPKQPEMDWALKALLHGSYQIQPGSTNLYGKFILIHGIMALIRRAQVDGGSTDLQYGTPPPHDWMVQTVEINSGRATPVNGIGRSMDLRSLKSLSTALDKFKSNWDIDMDSQFPPASGTENPRRHGFSRDGIHYYWLAKCTLKFTRPAELQLHPDERMMQIIHMLRSVRTWVMSDGASRGEELGSIGEIDSQYGTINLTLEMRQLFTPLPRVVGDAETASVKTEFGTTATG